jgi:hypothetical protein
MNAPRVKDRKSRLRHWYCQRFHKIGGPFQDENGSYERCLDCGERIPWSDPVPIPGPSLAKKLRLIVPDPVNINRQNEPLVKLESLTIFTEQQERQMNSADPHRHLHSHKQPQS